MRTMGADMIVLRPCYSCGEWPYLHKPDCPVAVVREAEREQLARIMAAALKDPA